MLYTLDEIYTFAFRVTVAMTEHSSFENSIIYDCYGLR